MARAQGRSTGGGEVPAPLLGRVVLVTGKEELLAERTVETLRHRVAAEHPDAEHAEVVGSELSAAALGELTAPSLFSALRCVVVRGLEQAPDTSYDGLLAYAAAPSDDVALALVHGGGPRGSGLLTKLRKLPAVAEVVSPELRPSELPGFVAGEVRRHRGGIDREAAELLVEAVGRDLRALAAAAHQLAHDFPGDQITAEVVGRYFGGRAEASGFAVADAAFAGQHEAALEALRWALAAGTAPVLVTSAFAGSARGLARYKGAPRGLREADLAREVGVPPWKLRTVRDQSRSWTDDALGSVIREVARADADVKGGAGDAAYALERLVLTVSGLRTRR